MKFIRLAAFLSLIASSCLYTLPARADQHCFLFLCIDSGPPHDPNLPYLESGQRTQNSQWENDDWTPRAWLSQRRDPMTLMQGFYDADIIRDQYSDDNIPVVEVGPNFYRLGGLEKRHVAETVDYVYQVTARGSMYELRDWKSGQAIGIYTSNGLQLE